MQILCILQKVLRESGIYNVTVAVIIDRVIASPHPVTHRPKWLSGYKRYVKVWPERENKRVNLRNQTAAHFDYNKIDCLHCVYRRAKIVSCSTY